MNNLRIEDIYWAAGFLEGEGSFMKNRNKNDCGTIIVSCSQVQKEPIDKLLFIFKCGNISFYERKNSNKKWSDVYIWRAYGEYAEDIMKLIYPIMSEKRKDQINTCLSWYALRHGKNFQKSGRKTCRSGRHEWTNENTFIDSRGKRTCRLCDRETKNRWQRIRREEAKLSRLNVSNN